MEQMTLEFQDRLVLKKSVSNSLRGSGRIPAVVYGQGKVATISVDSADFLKKFHLFGENTIIQLKNGKASYDVLVKDYQDDLLTGKIKHIDFYHVDATKTLHAKVPVHVTGTPAGVRDGGLLEHLLHEIEVVCLPKDLPHAIEVDVSALNIGDAIHIGALKLAEGVKILAAEDAIVAHVVNTRELVVETPVAVVAEGAEAGAEGAEAAGAEGAKPAEGAAKAPDKKA